ncbi:MAG: terminase small subunit [Gammaproteobacteria bacterium]|nr:terminase small subunit [Gammaproteobacteria bacterium]
MNERQRRFIAEYLRDGNCTQAAIRAGYSARTARQAGSRLLTNVDVRDALDVERAPVLERAKVTLEGHLAMLATIRDEARAAGHYGAAKAAEEARGRVSGFYVERSVVATRDLPTIVIR